LAIRLDFSGTYDANVIQIRKLDAAGVTLGVTKINETSDIVIDTTKSMFISPTIVNIEKDATESEIVYTAVTNENKVTYTLKSGFQKEKDISSIGATTQHKTITFTINAHCCRCVLRFRRWHANCVFLW
jgi:hypothetical protein